jgi:hypothetical protein
MPQEVDNNIIDNLQASDAKLGEINGQLDSLVSEYNKVTAGVSESSFFNLDNVYFWLVLAGLILLAFGLWFLMSELKYYSKEKKIKKAMKPATEPETIKAIVEKERKSIPVKPMKTKKKKKKKPVKIQVVKVK